jgi:hypothetical protein
MISDHTVPAGASNALKILPLSGIADMAGLGCGLDPVANDPKPNLLLAISGDFRFAAW